MDALSFLIFLGFSHLHDTLIDFDDCLPHTLIWSGVLANITTGI